MREIKFRGKRTDNGEWVEGLYNYFNWVNSLTREFIETTHHILPIGYQDSFKVFPETVGQFTGLTDRNGTPIFEGDIFRTKEFCLVGIPYSAHNHEVIFKNGCFLLNKVKGPYMALAAWNKMGEVIGNIHDNPELIEREAAE